MVIFDYIDVVGLVGVDVECIDVGGVCDYVVVG